MDKISDHFYVTFIAYLDSSRHSDEWYNKNNNQITVFEQVTADFVYVYLYFCFVFFVFFSKIIWKYKIVSLPYPSSYGITYNTILTTIFKSFVRLPFLGPICYFYPGRNHSLKFNY